MGIYLVLKFVLIRVLLFANCSTTDHFLFGAGKSQTMHHAHGTVKPKPKKKANKRKDSSTTTPASTILKYFKKTPIMHQAQAEENEIAGTPSTAAPNDLQSTPDTPKDADETDHSSEGAIAIAQSSVCVNSFCTPHSSTDINHVQNMSVQTPPSDDDSLIVETPPSSSTEPMNMGSLSSTEAVKCETTMGYAIKSQSDAYGTPVSVDNVVTSEHVELGTLPTHKNDTMNKENNPTDSATPSSESFQSTVSTTTNKTTKQRKQAQLYLDLGQKSFASHKICPICSSLIVHGTQEDQQNHINICKSYKEGVPCLGFKKERCVVRFGDERIIEVRGDDSPGKKKVEEVKRIVDGELGFASSTSNNIEHLVGKFDGLQELTSYLYISKKRIVGLLLVKRINKAYELLHETIDGVIRSVSRATTPHPSILGIHQIWVHSIHRQKGIATKLLECARGSFMFGMVIPIEKMAFSSPTEDGILLAKRYVGENEKIWVYDIC